jgi:hypothetical protein
VRAADSCAQAASPLDGHMEEGASLREPTAARYFFGFPLASALDVAGGRFAVQYRFYPTFVLLVPFGLCHRRKQQR